jgi:hypothetical protein
VYWGQPCTSTSEYLPRKHPYNDNQNTAKVSHPTWVAQSPSLIEEVEEPPNKKPATLVAGFLQYKQELTRLDVGSLLALGTLNNFKGHFLTLFERLESAHVDRGKVREQIFATIIGRNKTETLCVIEPFNCTVCHALLPYEKRRVEARQIV